ncbi:MAG: site-2 protease family protein [Candidatus Yanofskybacteria bacterium]|nr:site-2 protease family protein [Candidatus Yanofskybacteria bacterium]
MDALGITIFRVVVLIFSVVIHEVSHGFMARSLGDPTAERLGRLTLNPLRHLDPFGSVVLPLFLILTGSPFLFGYAKPVPYNPSALRDRVYGPAKVGVAGPLANILLAVLAAAAVRFLGGMLSPLAVSLMIYVVWVNLVLAVFNLIPVPPLDGHWLLVSLLPSRLIALKIALYRYQWVLLAVVVFILFPMLAPVLMSVLRLLTGASLF